MAKFTTCFNISSLQVINFETFVIFLFLQGSRPSVRIKVRNLTKSFNTYCMLLENMRNEAMKTQREHRITIYQISNFIGFVSSNFPSEQSRASLVNVT